MSQRQAMNELLNSKGKTIVIGGASYSVESVRMTYGAGVCLTLDRPLSGRQSRLFTVSANDECISVDLAKTIQ